MKAYHNDLAIKKKYIARMKAHIAADNLIRGEGWTDKGKGCAVGCTLEKYDHGLYETELGIPRWLAHVEDRLFEGMSLEKSKTFPLLFLESITPGAGLEKVKSKFLVIVLESALESFDHNKFPECKKSIEKVIALWKRKKKPTLEEFKKARADADADAAAYAYAAADAAAADAAADAAAAAYAAAAAADAAAYAAAAAAAAYAAARRGKFDYFADELLRLLKEEK